MINNKLVVIKKENIFDKGWALFSPYRDMQLTNKKYKPILVDDIVRRITYAKSVSLYLSEKCLSRKIIEELKWVNSYAKISITAKDREIADYYNSINFDKVNIVNDFTYNFIGIEGKEGFSGFFIADGFQNADNFEKVVSKKQTSIDFSVLKDADKIIICADGYKEYQDEIRLICDKNGIKLVHVLSKQTFKKEYYDKYVSSNVDLVVADYAVNGLVLVSNGKIFVASLINNQFVPIETESMDSFFGGYLYKNLGLKEILSAEEIPNDVFNVYNGEVVKLDQKDVLTIEKDVPIDTMANFLQEKFDRSETDNHNQYSSVAKKVEYKFTLIPPLYRDDYKYSAIYDYANKELSIWKDKVKLNVGKIIKELSAFENNESLSNLLNDISDANETVNHIIGELDFALYHNIFNNCKAKLLANKDNIINCCLELSSAISSEISGSQNSKIDDEIAGYERTIKEKENLIAKNIDVLQSKRRIQILKSKIEELLLIKEKFVSKQSGISSNNNSDFCNFCKNIILGSLKDIEQDSVSSIVNSKEQTKKEQLENFLKKYLKDIYITLNVMIELLDDISLIDVPEDYVVYDYNGQRYIIIKEELEFKKTMALQEKYKLECVVRR